MGLWDDIKKSFSELGSKIREAGQKLNETDAPEDIDCENNEVNDIRKKLERFGLDEDKATEEKPDVIVDNGDHD